MRVVKRQLELVTIPLLKIGGVSYKNMPSLISKTDTNLIFECFEIDGFIGSNLLRHSIVQILPQEQLIKLTNNKKKLSLKRKNASKIEFLDKQSTPFIWIELNANDKVKEQVYVDTGMSGFYDLSNNHLKIFQKDAVFTINSEASGSLGTGLFGSENESTYYQLVIPKIEINNTLFNDITVQTTNDINSRIGSGILLYGNLTIDYINKRFYYESFQNNINLKEPSFGFSPTLIDNKLVIGLVWDDHLKDKITYGDQIVEINGKNVLNANVCDLSVENPSLHK